jgi:hypothetical protein
MKIKLCQYCKHLSIINRYGIDNFYKLECDMDVWYLDSFTDGRKELAKLFESAKTCKHFKNL